MRITIIGAGNVGKALGEGWAKKHDVKYLKRGASPDERATLVNEADAVVLAVPGDQLQAAVSGLPLAGKTLIDCTNPLKADLSGLQIGHTTSAAEQLAALVPDAKVVKAFNTVGFGIMANPRFGDSKAMMMIAGNDSDAKQKTMALAADLGFEPIDAGPLAQSRLLEPLAMLWISLAIRGGLGREFAFGLLRR
jgi:8-hydroxy-5-deazaflavin:NADPH oxidoreductase